MKKRFLTCISLIIFLSGSATAQQSNISTLPLSVEKLEKDIPALMKAADIPGMSAALIENGKLSWYHHYGVMNATTKEPVNEETIFEAASLSKPVTAYAALKLVDDGKLDLDKPLNQYLGNNYEVGDDQRINLITARMVLSHSGGFPNWRPKGSPTLPINFSPGEKFSYSGEGFVYLSRVMEKITHMKFEDFIKEMVFIPLGMKQSSFIWLDEFSKLQVYRHDWLGNPSYRAEEKGANAAASMRTTARDYAIFVITLLNGTGLKKNSWMEMLKPQINVNEKTAPGVSWGLGIGLETTETGKYFWHWGDQGDSKCYVTANIDQKNAIVYFTNSSNGLSITKEILDDAIGGTHPALAWLNYGRYDPAAKALFKSIVDNGAATALQSYRERISIDPSKILKESTINSLGYALLRMKKVDDAIAVFAQNTLDYPNSGNVWDSLAEGYMIKGDKENAIRYYEKSLQVDPGNTNAVEQLKKLKS